MRDRDLITEELDAIQEQQIAVRNACHVIVLSFPPLLGFEVGHAPELGPMQGRMAGRFFALFSMWIIQRAKYATPEQKIQASRVIEWVMESCKL
jgi:hypothetical protein